MFDNQRLSFCLKYFIFIWRCRLFPIIMAFWLWFLLRSLTVLPRNLYYYNLFFYMNKGEIFKNSNKSCSCTFWCLGRHFFIFRVSTYHEGFEMIKIYKVLPKTKLNMTGQQLVAVLSAKFCLNAQIELRPAEQVCYSRTKGFIYCIKILLYCISSQWLYNFFVP